MLRDDRGGMIDGMMTFSASRAWQDDLFPASRQAPRPLRCSHFEAADDGDDTPHIRRLSPAHAGVLPRKMIFDGFAYHRSRPPQMH